MTRPKFTRRLPAAEYSQADALTLLEGIPYDGCTLGVGPRTKPGDVIETDYGDLDRRAMLALWKTAEPDLMVPFILSNPGRRPATWWLARGEEVPGLELGCFGGLRQLARIVELGELFREEYDELAARMATRPRCRDILRAVLDGETAGPTGEACEADVAFDGLFLSASVTGV